MIQTLELNASSRDGRGKTKQFITPKNDISSNKEHTSLAQTLLSPISSVIKAVDITNITDMPNPISMTGA